MAGKLTERIEAARAELARLEREALSATCAELGHAWSLYGGRNCGCHDTAGCSLPVYGCDRCGDCDYGDNAEADTVREECRALAEEARHG